MSSDYLYIISDGTGETAATMVRAALVQYPDKDVSIVRAKNIRTELQLANIVDEVFEKKGLIVFTIAGASLSRRLKELCGEKGIRFIDLLGPVMTELDVFFGRETTGKTGILRAVNENYFKRIEAIEFTVKHDDGKSLTGLKDADIVLVGISRTSKTPLSIFLSHKGWKVANIPLVLSAPLPKELFEIDQRRIVGLIIDIESLQRIRKNRLEKFGQDTGAEYASMQNILKEIEFAEALFKQNKRWPVFNVTERALEETASEIVKIVSARLGLPESVLF